MELLTYSKNNDFAMPMFYEEKNPLDQIRPLQNRLCFILLENGNGIIKLNNKSIIFTAPMILCLNEKDCLSIDNSLNLKARIIYFHPSIINAVFNFENIRNLPKAFSMSTIQDQYWLNPFIKRNDNYHGKLSVGPITGKRFAYLCEKFKNEVTLQGGANWPCRSRSYIMEILFLIGNIESELDVQQDTIINEEENEISSIILYLINNYHEKITIPQLSKQFNINRTTLSENFNNAIGESIISYLNKLRINIASIILRDTKLPISEIMTRVGFNENTHFFRTFKKYRGMSPRDYRDKYCSM